MKVKVQILEGAFIPGQWQWCIIFPKGNEVAGPLVANKATARRQWLRFADRMGVPRSAWEFETSA